MKAKKKTTAVDKQRSNKGQMKTRNSDPPNESCTFVSNNKVAAKKLNDAAVSTTKPLSKTCTAKKKVERDKSSSSSSSSNIKVNIEEEPISSTNQSALLKSADSTEDSIKGEKGESTTGCQYERQEKNEEKQDSSTSVKSSSETRSSSKDGKTKAISKMLKSLGIKISGFDNIIPGEEQIIEELKSSISENVKTKSRATVVKVFSPSNSITFSSASSTSNRPILSKKDEKKTNANDIEIDSKNKESSPKKSNDKVFRLGQNSVAATITTTTAERAVTTEKITKTDFLFTEDSHEKEHEKEPLGETKKKLANKKSKVEVNSRKKKQSKEKHNNDIELEEKEISANQSSLKLVEESDSKQQFEPAEPSDTKNTTLKMKNSKKIDKNISKVEHDLADSCASSSQINLPSAMDDKHQLPPHKTIAAAPPPKGIKSTPKSKSCSFNKGTTAEKPDREQIEPNLKAVTEGFMPSNSQDTASDTSVQGSEQNQPTNNATRRITNEGLSIRQRLQSKYKVIPIKGKKLKVHKKSKTTTGYSKCGSEVKMKTSGDEVEQPTKKDIYDFKSGSESEENIKMELPILKNLRREFSDDDDKPLKINESLEKNVNQENLTIESSSNIVADPIERDLTGDVTKKSTKKVAKNKTASTGTTKKTDSITDLKKHPTVKVKKGKSAKNLTDNDSTSDSEDEKKLIVFGQKRHRMASLNALAKVQCLYENESRTAYELGLSKTVQVIPKMRTLNSSGSEDERGKDCLAVVKREQSTSNKNLKDLTSLKIEPKEIAGDDSSPAVNIETTKRELRKVPGRGVGKHWEFDSETENDEDIVMIKLKLKKKKLQKLKNLQAKKDRNKEQTTTTTATTVKSKKNLKTIKKTLKILQQSSDGSNSELSDNNDKKKQSPYQSVVAIKKCKKPKREFKEETFGGGDYRGILARKRMASLNASAIVAATYEVERHLDMNLASDCDSFESEIMMATEKSQTSNTRKAKISSNNKKTVTGNSKIDDKITKEENLKDTICKDLNIADESNDSKLSKETKTSTSIDATQKDSVKEGSSSSRPTSSSVVIVQDTDVTITGVYVNSKSGSGQEAYCKMQYRVQSSVTEERVLRPGSTEPPKSYTPLDALSSMRPPGSSNNSGNISSSAVADENLSTTPPQTSSSSLPDSNNSNMYHQPPNDLMVHDMSENSSSYGYRGHHVAAQSPMNQYQQHQYQVVENPSVPMHHYGHPVATSSLATGIHQYQQQQIECDSPSLAYQSNANVYQISNPGSGGGSAFCSPIIQQQQSHQHDVGGYYQPAGPLISPHVLQSTTQPNAQHIAPGSKKQISPSLDPDSEQLQNASQTISVGDNAHGGEVLITGGDLATFRYHSQQHAQGVQGHLQQGQSHQVHHQQQQHQQHIHHQVAAGPVSPYPRSIHAPMHYTSAYPPNYYSPYPGEAMCYSPPYQPYFPTKIYQSAPPPPSAYRRYPPYYQQGLPPPPSASDIYEQTAQSSVGHQLPPPPPSAGGTQIVPTGPAHAQHLEHYPGPPGYYSGYSPGGSRCYTRSIQAPFMEYSPQCPCPMQQSCPKNVHTGPHIGSNTCSSIINNNSLITTSSSNNNNNNNNTTTTNNNINSNNNNNNMNSNNISMVTSANNNTIKSNMNHSSNNDSRNNNNTSNLTSSLTNNNKPILYQVTPNHSSTNVNKSSSEQLNTGRGPVKNATYARDNNGDKKQETFTTIAQPVHHNQHNIHHNQSHIIQTCDIKILKPIVKSEIRSEDLDDTKNSQYEEDVVHPPTPPLAFETNGGKCMEKEIVPLELIDDDDIIVEKESENIKLNFDRKISSSEKSANLDGAYDDLSTVAAAPLLVGRKARIGKSMAREMMYAGAAAINQIRILQAQVTTPQRVQQHQQISSQLSPSLCINNNIKNNNNTTDNSCNIALSNDTSDHICANHLHHIDGVSRGGGGGLVGGGPAILLKAEIKAEKEIKKEDDDLILMMHGDHVDNHEIKDIKSEPEYVEKVVKDGTQIGYNDQHSTNNPFLPPPSIMNDDLYMHAPQNSSSGPKRIKILEVHKSQCKRSPTNSYKNLIKQAEPKTYLCLSRKFADKRNRFGKMHKFKQCGIRKRHLILTDQQKRRLRLRKRKIDQCRKQKTTKTVVQHNSSAVRKTVMTKKYITNTKFALTNSIQKNAITNNKLSSDILNNANNTTTRGYYSEPESSVYVTLSSSSLVERRKIKKSKTSGVRSKSETKRPTNLQLKTIISNNSSPTSIVKQQTEQQQTMSTTKGQTMSPMSKAKKIDSENDTKNKVKNNMKVNLSLVDNNKSNKSRTKANLAQKAFSIDPDNDRDISDNKVTNILDNSTQSEQFEINDNSLITTFNNNNNNDNNNFLEANDNTNFEQQAATTIGVNGSTENDDKQIGQKQQQQQQQQHVFLQPLPSLPRIICQHLPTIKRTRSRSKFGCRKRQKLKHSVSFEVDETVPLTRTDVIPKWNNGWAWEGEPFQGAVFLNSDDPLVIRTCYPAMRHVEGDIIQTRDCVLLKANEANELPYVAKVAHLWENPEDGEMMMSLLWYYRPEHTEQGRQSNDSPDEVYASRHRDHNSVACVEDKCFVLTFSEYCRYRRKLRASEEDIEDVSVVPKRPNIFNSRLLPDNTNPELVMFCRRAYEFRTKRLLKMPNKQDYYVVNS